MTSTFVSKRTVEAVPAEPPRYSLLRVLPPISDGERWQGGIQWTPEQIGGGGAAAYDWCPAFSPNGTNAARSVKANIGTADADPFLVWAEDHCSTLGFQARDYESRARRQLEATQSYWIAKELWSGAQAIAATPDLDNTYLTKDPDNIGGAAAAPAGQLAKLERGLALMLFGRRGLIHVSPQILDVLAETTIITQTGQIWQTPMGTPIVSDAGYDGSKPVGSGSTNEWMYATPMIGVRLTAVEVLPATLAEAVNRATNLATVYAQRQVLLQWDDVTPAGTKLGVLAVETNVPAITGL